jgi:PAS domain S-box-containing protein
MRIEAESSSTARSARWELAGAPSHGVQFYKDESFLLERLSQFIGSAILAGNSALVIATQAQRDSLLTHLKSRGLDLTVAEKEGRYASLDAAETLAKFLVEGKPQFELFASVIGPVIKRLASAARGETREVFVFGQMVALLWAAEDADAAVQLEHFWNQLAQTHTFQLYCSYPLHLFSRAEDSKVIERICAEHTQVIPTESYVDAASEQDRFRAIALLQQKAGALDSEILNREKARQVLEEREAELRNFLDNAVIGMHWIAQNGIILWANKSQLSLLNLKSDEYIGHHISEFHADPEVIEDILKRLALKEGLRGYEARLRCKDGSIRDIRIDSNFYQVNDDEGHTRCFITDVTEKKWSERELLHLAAIVESSDDAIVGKNLNGIVTSWNLSAERIFGYTSEEMIGKPIALLIPPELQQDEVTILSKIRSGQRIDHFQTVRIDKKGQRVDVSLTISPVKDRDGKIIGAAKIIRDVTQQKKLESALHVTERLASVGRLAATVAHEINNPLESVVNLLYLAINTEGIPESARNNLVIADQELARVAHIAQQTLGFYRDTAHPTWMSLTGLVDSVLRVYERRIFYKGITVEQRIGLELDIFAHQGELKQILSNLLSNAIDASRQHGKIWIRVHATTGSSKLGPGIRIVLADNGGGIPPEIADHVFMPFFTTKADVGTGIGLWVTRNLIEKRGGSIRCRSSQNPSSSGTVMSIFIPNRIPEKNSLTQTISSGLYEPVLTPGFVTSLDQPAILQSTDGISSGSPGHLR